MPKVALRGKVYLGACSNSKLYSYKKKKRYQRIDHQIPRKIQHSGSQSVNSVDKMIWLSLVVAKRLQCTTRSKFVFPESVLKTSHVLERTLNAGTREIQKRGDCQVESTRCAICSGNANTKLKPAHKQQAKASSSQ